MDLKLLKMRCKDGKQHHVMFHELYSVSSLTFIAHNIRFKIPYKVSYFLDAIFNYIQILCLGVLWYRIENFDKFFELQSAQIMWPLLATFRLASTVFVATYNPHQSQEE